MKLLVIDNFLSDPMKERERALQADYRPVDHNGIDYRGISVTSDPENQKRLDELVTGKENMRAQEVTCFYRRYLESEESETWIHSDVQIGHFTAVLFLSLPEHCKGGIAFWRHKLYGWNAHPDPAALGAQGLRDSKELWKSVHADGFDQFKWELEDYVPMFFNRLVLFYSPRFHSRFPKRAFGTDIQNARLIKTWFLKYE